MNLLNKPLNIRIKSGNFDFLIIEMNKNIGYFVETCLVGDRI